jgi:hypothetical protein
MIHIDAKYDRTKAIDISKFTRRFEVLPPEAGRPASTGEFSPGKNHPSSVADYVATIRGNWQRGVDAFMNIARLCAEANARLTITRKSELMPKLPFGEATFSKFVRIGNDARLHAPEVQSLLPPHYTTTYAVTLLTDQELKQAISEKVICPDMKREQLQRWRSSHRELSRIGFRRRRRPRRVRPAVSALDFSISDF